MPRRATTKSIGNIVAKAFSEKKNVTMGEVMQAAKKAFPPTEEMDIQYAIEVDYVWKCLYAIGDSWPIVEAFIAPVSLSKKQKKILDEWSGRSDRDESVWNPGADGHGGEFAILESIVWQKVRKEKFPRFI